MIIILISLLVDVNRAAMLRRVAQKHKSQALEADALHFTTDIWSSGVVLVGLLCVQASEYLPADSPFRGILHMADAIAALFVSGIVVVVGFRLSRRAVTMLLDGGGKEHSEALEQALAKQLPLCRVRRLRVRESGADVFMDITVEAPATLRLDAAHDVSCVIEDIAHEIVQLMPYRRGRTGRNGSITPAHRGCLALAFKSDLFRQAEGSRVSRNRRLQDRLL